MGIIIDLGLSDLHGSYSKDINDFPIIKAEIPSTIESVFVIGDLPMAPWVHTFLIKSKTGH